MYAHKTLSTAFQADIDRQDKSSTRSVERQLIKAAQNGCSKSRARLINSHLGHIIQYAKLYNTSNIPLDDMVAEGTLGFERAINMFDLNGEGLLTTFSKAWIRAFVQKAIFGNHLVPMSVKDRKALGKSYSNDSETTVAGHQYESLDVASEDGKTTRHESFSMDDEVTIEGEVNAQKQYSALLNLLERGTRQYHIIEQYAEGKTNNQIGEQLGLSRQRVNVILHQTLDTLRKRATLAGIISEDDRA
jgi:RNA polymerase sigma factor (sigma-70 family)